MSAAAAWAPIERYDLSCAFCKDGVPEGRFRGKACCRRCGEAFNEGCDGAVALPPPPPDAGPMPPLMPPSPTFSKRRLRELIRYLLGVDPRESPQALYERALRARGTYRGES